MVRAFIQRSVVCACVLLAAVAARADGAPTNAPRRTVFVLQSYARDAAPFNAVALAFCDGLRSRMKGEGPVQILLSDMDATRHGAGSFDPKTSAAAIRSRVRGVEVDLVVAVGDPAARLIAGVRDEVVPGVPVLLVACHAVPTARELAGSNTVILAQQLSAAPAASNILRLLPATTSIVVVAGTTAPERAMVHRFSHDFMHFTNRVSFPLLGDLSLDDTRAYCSNLPPRSAILYLSLARDGAGVEYDYAFALQRLLAVANAPVFTLFESQFGDRVVGGPLVPDTAIGEKAAEVAVRLLKGEKPEDIAVPVFEAGAPVYDGRELKRWHIAEGLLPPDRRIVFRPPTAWEEYRVQIVLLLSGIAVQGLLIAALLVHRGRLIRAQREVQLRRAELAHVSRVSTMGELASSMAHELNQPLAAIMTNAEAAEIHTRQAAPDMPELKSILDDIRTDALRAGETIHRMRAFLQRHEIEMQPLDVERLVRESVRYVETDAAARRIAIRCQVEPGMPPGRGDRIQLQQVLLNLLVNGMDAMNGHSEGPRQITVDARRISAGMAEVSVSDRGHGIPAEKLAEIFEPFVTTKSSGLGMGLAISRSIVEAHGGRLWLENNPEGGATARFTIPIAAGAVDHGPSGT